MNLSFKETGRLTLKLFNKLYQHYKDNFDLELSLKLNRKTYASLELEQEESEEWF